MDQVEQDKIKKQLLELRRSVMQEVSDAYAASQELGLNGVPDIGDVAANTYSRDVLLNLSEGQRQKLRPPWTAWPMANTASAPAAKRKLTPGACRYVLFPDTASSANRTLKNLANKAV